MNLQQLPFNLFDLAFVIILLIGLLQGRKNGMSGELFNLIKWACIAVVGGMLYGTVSQYVAKADMFGPLGSYITAYVAIALVILMFFALIKHRVGSKLVGSDVFGKAEYYLGMGSGVLRAFFIVVVGLALLNARYFSEQEIRANEAYQKDVYGSEFFPGLHSCQKHVFEDSMVGPYLHDGLNFLFIEPTAPSNNKFKQKDYEVPW